MGGGGGGADAARISPPPRSFTVNWANEKSAQYLAKKKKLYSTAEKELGWNKKSPDQVWL